MENTIWTQEDLKRKMIELTGVLRNDEQSATVGTEQLQMLMECLIKAYARKIQFEVPETAHNTPLMPIPMQSSLSDTEVLILVDKLLELKKIDLFEVQMFRSLCINN